MQICSLQEIPKSDLNNSSLPACL